MPLAVLGAIYTSQFVHPRLKARVKPTVEIMAALPSVVLGFLAGLWLAPRVERDLVPVLLLLAVPAALRHLGRRCSGIACPGRLAARACARARRWR